MWDRAMAWHETCHESNKQTSVWFWLLSHHHQRRVMMSSRTRIQCHPGIPEVEFLKRNKQASERERERGQRLIDECSFHDFANVK